MNKIHLNWDGYQNNGIIFNDEYTWGAMFTGAEYKPVLSFDYYYMQYSEVFPESYVIPVPSKNGLGGKRRIMTDEEKAEVKAIAATWIQPVGQEGNPSEEQLLEQLIAKANNILNMTNIIMTIDMLDMTTIEEKVIIKDIRLKALNTIRNPNDDQIDIPLDNVNDIIDRFYNKNNHMDSSIIEIKDKNV